MKTLDVFKTGTARLLTLNDLLSIRGGTSEEDKNKKPKEERAKVDYPTIDTPFDMWPEPEV